MKDVKVEIVSGRCVNSHWKADWLTASNEEGCECIVSCKVVISVEQNGHSPRRYTVTESEYKDLKN